MTKRGASADRTAIGKQSNIHQQKKKDTKNTPTRQEKEKEKSAGNQKNNNKNQKEQELAMVGGRLGSRPATMTRMIVQPVRPENQYITNLLMARGGRGPGGRLSGRGENFQNKGSGEQGSDSESSRETTNRKWQAQGDDDGQSVGDMSGSTNVAGNKDQRGRIADNIVPEKLDFAGGNLAVPTSIQQPILLVPAQIQGAGLVTPSIQQHTIPAPTVLPPRDPRSEESSTLLEGMRPPVSPADVRQGRLLNFGDMPVLENEGLPIATTNRNQTGEATSIQKWLERLEGLSDSERMTMLANERDEEERDQEEEILRARELIRKDEEKLRHLLLAAKERVQQKETNENSGSPDTTTPEQTIAMDVDDVGVMDTATNPPPENTITTAGVRKESVQTTEPQMAPGANEQGVQVARDWFQFGEDDDEDDETPVPLQPFRKTQQRYQLKIRLTPVGQDGNPFEVLRDQLRDWVTKLKEADPTMTIYSWKLRDRNPLLVISEADDVPDDLNLIQQYFANARTMYKTKKQAENWYVSALIGHDKKFLDLQVTLKPWLFEKRLSIYAKTLQCEEVNIIGWLWLSHRDIEPEALIEDVWKRYQVRIGAFWRVIASPSVDRDIPENQKVRALHIEIDKSRKEDYDAVRRIWPSRKLENLPLDIRMRFVPTGPFLYANREIKMHDVCMENQREWLKKIRLPQPLPDMKAIDFEEADNRVVGLQSPRELIMAIRSRRQPNMQVFHSLGKNREGEVTFVCHPNYTKEARKYIASVLIFLLSKAATAEHAKQLIQMATRSAQKETWQQMKRDANNPGTKTGYTDQLAELSSGQVDQEFIFAPGVVKPGEARKGKVTTVIDDNDSIESDGRSIDTVETFHQYLEKPIGSVAEGSRKTNESNKAKGKNSSNGTAASSSSQETPGSKSSVSLSNLETAINDLRLENERLKVSLAATQSQAATANQPPQQPAAVLTNIPAVSHQEQESRQHLKQAPEIQQLAQLNTTSDLNSGGANALAGGGH